MASSAMGTPEEREVRREAPRDATTTGSAYGTAATSGAAARNSVQWGPVWGGLIASFAIFLLLETFAVGVGLVTADNTGASAWTTGVIALIAFFVGGWIAQAVSVVRGPVIGLVNGLMVWALGTALAIGLSLFGLSTLFGAVGTLVGQFFATGHTIGNVASNLPAVSNITSQVQNAGWGSFFTLLLTAIAAAVGGWFGNMTGLLGRSRGAE
jgi:cation transport ATPase